MDDAARHGPPPPRRAKLTSPLFEKHRHAVVQLRHVGVRVGGDDGEGPRGRLVRLAEPFPQTRERRRLPILPSDGIPKLTCHMVRPTRCVTLAGTAGTYWYVVPRANR